MCIRIYFKIGPLSSRLLFWARVNDSNVFSKSRRALRTKVLSPQHTATHCTTLQHTAPRCNTFESFSKSNRALRTKVLSLQHTATHCTTLQHSAPRCNTLRHTATRCNPPHVSRIQESPNNNGSVCCCVLQCVAVCCCVLWSVLRSELRVRDSTQVCSIYWRALHTKALSCNTLQHTATHCNTAPR